MLNFIQWLKKFILKMQRDKISVYAAQSAYFIILSFFPFCYVFADTAELPAN